MIRRFAKVLNRPNSARFGGEVEEVGSRHAGVDPIDPRKRHRRLGFLSERVAWLGELAELRKALVEGTAEAVGSSSLGAVVGVKPRLTTLHKIEIAHQKYRAGGSRERMMYNSVHLLFHLMLGKPWNKMNVEQLQTLGRRAEEDTMNAATNNNSMHYRLKLVGDCLRDAEDDPIQPQQRNRNSQNACETSLLCAAFQDHLRTRASPEKHILHHLLT